MAFAEYVGRGRAARGQALLLVERSRALQEASRILIDRYQRDRARRGEESARSTVSVQWPTSSGSGPSSTSSSTTATAVQQAKPATPDCAASFEVEGLIEDRPVRAAFEKGTLSCDPLLRAHAELVVALGDWFICGPSNESRTAALEGDPVVVLATLMRAMRVTRVEVAI